MKDYKTLFVLGIVFLIVPFLGVPEIYRDWVVAIAAVILIIYSLRTRHIIKKEKGEDIKEMFVEANGESKEEVQNDIVEDHVEISSGVGLRVEQSFTEEPEEYEEEEVEESKIEEEQEESPIEVQEEYEELKREDNE